MAASVPSCRQENLPQWGRWLIWGIQLSSGRSGRDFESTPQIPCHFPLLFLLLEAQTHKNNEKIHFYNHSFSCGGKFLIVNQSCKFSVSFLEAMFKCTDDSIHWSPFSLCRGFVGCSIFLELKKQCSSPIPSFITWRRKKICPNILNWTKNKVDYEEIFNKNRRNL